MKSYSTWLTSSRFKCIDGYKSWKSHTILFSGLCLSTDAPWAFWCLKSPLSGLWLTVCSVIQQRPTQCSAVLVLCVENRSATGVFPTREPEIGKQVSTSWRHQFMLDPRYHTMTAVNKPNPTPFILYLHPPALCLYDNKMIQFFRGCFIISWATSPFAVLQWCNNYVKQSAIKPTCKHLI